MSDQRKNTPRRGRKSNSLRSGLNPTPEKAKSVIEGLKAAVQARSGYTPQQFADYIFGEAGRIADEATGRHKKQQGGWYEFTIPGSPLCKSASLADLEKQHLQCSKRGGPQAFFHKESAANIAQLKRYLYDPSNDGSSVRHSTHSVNSRLLGLIADVEQITGRKHYKEIAQILSAFGCPTRESRLRRLWSNHLIKPRAVTTTK